MRTFPNGHAQIATDVEGRFLSFATGEFAERMRVTADGNVGIGTTAPITLLSNTNTNIIDPSLMGLSSGSLGWRISENGYVAGLRNDATTSSAHGLLVSTAAASDNQYPLMVSSGGSPRFFVRGSGQTVVGSALPAGAQLSEALEVNGTTRIGKIRSKCRRSPNASRASTARR